MPKIDINAIEGYENMTPDEKLAALEAYEYEAPPAGNGTELEKLKNAVSKANSEAADLKRQLKAKQTAEEQAEAERAATAKALQEELETLRKEKTVSTYKSSYLALGYDENLAEETAKAMADGKTDVVFSNQKAFNEAQKQAFIKETLEGTPRPQPGELGDKSITKEQFDVMGYKERLKLFEEQPKLYEELTGGTK